MQKKVLNAERGGFEPPVRAKRTHAFQACAFDRSATSPKKRKYRVYSLPIQNFNLLLFRIYIR